MTEVVCGIIRNAAGEYLACRRPAEKHLGGLWEFPGGKVEIGETPEEALVRELFEELGIDVEVGEALTAVEWSHDGGEIRLRPYLCRISGGELQAKEHDELIWCQATRFSSMTWAPADVPICNELLR